MSTAGSSLEGQGQSEGQKEGTTKADERNYLDVIIPRFPQRRLVLNERENNSVIRKNPSYSTPHDDGLIVAPFEMVMRQQAWGEDVSSCVDRRSTNLQTNRSWVITRNPRNESTSLANSLRNRSTLVCADDDQFSDFENFRTTSILTLRNRAEKYVQRLNVC